MVKERKTNFIDLLKAFWKEDEVEISDTENALESALKNAEISDEDKQLLLKTSKELDKAERKAFFYPDKKTKKAKLDVKSNTKQIEEKASEVKERINEERERD